MSTFYFSGLNLFHVWGMYILNGKESDTHLNSEENNYFGCDDFRFKRSLLLKKEVRNEEAISSHTIISVRIFML